MPMGTPVSSAFTVLGDMDAASIRHTLDVIDSIHGEGIIPLLTARKEILEDLNEPLRTNPFGDPVYFLDMQ